VAATLGFPDAAVDGKDLDTIRSKIPAGLILAVEKCVASCRL